jgi:hypothetical protein
MTQRLFASNIAGSVIVDRGEGQKGSGFKM